METCQHEFSEGLCTRCLDPETKYDSLRSRNALGNRAALIGQWSEHYRCFITPGLATEMAWRIHRRRDDD